MHIKTDCLAPITYDEKIFIRTLADKEFKSTNLCENIRLKSKIYDICYKLRVSSFEEVLRKVLFYKLFEIDLSQEYRNYINTYSREKIFTLCAIRNILLDAGKNVSEVFAKFCENVVLWNNEDFKEMVKKCIDDVKSNEESYRIFNSVQSFINIVNVKHDFDQMFNLVFDLNDFEYIEDAERVAETFNSLAVKYIFVVRILMEHSYPLNIKHMITTKRRDLIRFLLYKGDEIDYMEQYEISPLVFHDEINSIIASYNTENLQETLLKANMAITLADASLMDECINLHIRSSVYIQNKNRVADLAPKSQKEFVEQLIEKIVTVRNNNFLQGTSLFDKYLNVSKSIPDYCHTINGKLDIIKEWFEENVLPLDIVEQLAFLQSELEDVIPYEKILKDL